MISDMRKAIKSRNDIKDRPREYMPFILVAFAHNILTMTVTLFYLALLICTVGGQLNQTDDVFTRSVCKSKKICQDYSLNCTNTVILVRKVWLNLNKTCDSSRYNCCCGNHLTQEVFLNKTALRDVKHLCDGESNCSLWSYVHNVTGKLTADYSCQETTTVAPSSSSPSMSTSTELSNPSMEPPSSPGFDSTDAPSSSSPSMSTSTELSAPSVEPPSSPGFDSTDAPASASPTLGISTDLSDSTVVRSSRQSFGSTTLGETTHTVNADKTHCNESDGSTVAIVVAVVVLAVVLIVAVAVLSIKRRCSTEGHTDKHMTCEGKQADIGMSRKGTDYISYENNDISYYETPIEHRDNRSSDAIYLTPAGPTPVYTNIQVESTEMGCAVHVDQMDNLYLDLDLQSESFDNGNTYGKMDT